MATIIENRNKAGEIVSYKFKVCLGRDAQYRQIQRTTTIKRPKGLTPAKERKEVQRLADEWEREQKEDFSQYHSRTNRETITLESFVKDHWWPDHILDGEHPPAPYNFKST